MSPHILPHRQYHAGTRDERSAVQPAGDVEEGLAFAQEDRQSLDH